MSIYVSQLDLTLADQLKADLIAQGFDLAFPAYTLFQGKKKDLVCTLYASGKLVVQGKKMREFVEMYLEPELLKNFSLGYESVYADFTPRIGGDESGKGDFFGPLVIAALFADKEGVEKLLEMGVKDSKKLSETTIERLALKIRKQFHYHIIRLHPVKYNELYARFGNLNSLLGWAHAAAIRAVAEKTGCHTAIIDKFASDHVVINALQRQKEGHLIKITQKVKGEEDPVVAGASILARHDFVQGLQNLEQLCNEKLPKGASQGVLATGVRLAKKAGLAELSSLAKIHFSTYEQIRLLLEKG